MIRSVLLSAASLAALAFNPACAQTWQGTTPDWGAAANWSTGAVPMAAGAVVIGAGGPANPSISGIAANAYTLYIGATGAGRSLSLTDGGSLNAYSTSIGYLAGQTGAVTVAGPGTTFSGNFVYVGDNGIGSLELSGGASASFEFAQSGFRAGSVGVTTLSGANTSFYTINGHIVGDSGEGTLVIQSGAKADDRAATLGYNAGAKGTATITGAGSFWNIRGVLMVANAGRGDAYILNGARVATAINTIVGEGAGSYGTLTLDGAGSRLDTAGYTTIGNSGRGSALILGGAVHQTQQGIMARYAGSQADLRVTGADTLWLGTTYLMVGHLGTAEASFDSGGTVRLNGGAGQVVIANGAGSTGTVNIGAAQGAVALAPGYLDVATIRFGSGTGKLVFNHTAADYVVNAAIVGKGTLITESGTTILNGANTYTGATEVRGGTLIVNSTIATSSGLTVAAGAVVGGSGSLPSMTVNGVLSPGNSPGTLTVNGNLTLNPGATYVAEIEGPVADRVNVTGSAALAGTLRLVSLGGASRFLTPYTLLSAQAGRTGMFDTVVPNFGAAVGASVSYTATSILVTLEPRPLLPFAGATRNGSAVAAGIDRAVAGGGDPSSLFPIYNLPAAAIPAAVNQLSGEVHTAAPAMANVAADQFLRAMLDPMAAGRLGAGAPGPGAAAFSGLVRKGTDEPGAPSRLDATLYSVWGSAFGSYGRTDGDAAIGSARRTIDDTHVATGIDLRLMPGTIAGLAVAGGKTRASLPGLAGKIDADVFQAGLYGTTQLGLVKLGAAASYARLDNDASRGIPALGSSLSSSYETTAWSGRLQASMAAFTWGGLSLSPLAALQATHVRNPAAVEANWAGASAGALALRGRSETTSRGELGLQLDADGLFGGVPVTGYVRAAWAHYFQREVDLTASLVGLPSAVFTATGAADDRNRALVAAGISARLSERVTVGLNFDGELASSNSRLGGSAQIRVSF